MDNSAVKLKNKLKEIKTIQLIDAHHHWWDLNLHKYSGLKIITPIHLWRIIVQ